MPIFHVNFDLKPGSKALGRLQKNGDDLVKAMKIVGENRLGYERRNNVTGVGNGNDKFKEDIVRVQQQLEGLNETSGQLSEGNKILDSIEKMINDPVGVNAKVKEMQVLWGSMTETGRELRNADLVSILKIKNSIKHVLDLFAKLRYNGIAIFSRRVNMLSSSSLKYSNTNSVNNNTDGRGEDLNNSTATLNFVRFYDNIKQNLTYVENNINNYNEKSTITINFRNCELTVNNMLIEVNKKRNKFNNLNNMVYSRKKHKANERDSLIKEKQNQLSLQAVVNILER